MFRKRFARSVGERKVCFPSIITITPALPRRLILPSLSTETPGDFSNISNAVEPALVGDDSTLTIVLSILVSMKGFFAVTVTPSIDFASAANLIVSAFTTALSVVISND